MKIIDKINSIHTFLDTHPEGGKAFARQLQLLAVDAIAGGLTSTDDNENKPSGAWETYMKVFASNPQQLQRLNGLDTFAQDNTWGKEALCYMAANATCTMGTTTDTGRLFDDDMREGLDRDLPSTEDSDFLKGTEEFTILKYM